MDRSNSNNNKHFNRLLLFEYNNAEEVCCFKYVANDVIFIF
jgi:hypothetical protein